jgi:hypothetical protein
MADLPQLAPDGIGVRARCPDCGGIPTTFEGRESSREFGTVLQQTSSAPGFVFQSRPFIRAIYRLVRCSVCGRGGLATIYDSPVTFKTEDQKAHEGKPGVVLVEFFPVSIETLPLPTGCPLGIANEFREAERCASIGAWRGAIALLRSTVEKAFRVNGYDPRKSLKDRIDEAASDGIIRLAHRERAHKHIRLLGNDILHDDWREVTPDEFDDSHTYVQWILQDFYDARPEVEQILKKGGKVTHEPVTSGYSFRH